MKTLTEFQKEFLSEKFFKNEKYPAWKTIVTKLLENGTCIVASEECIWVGGVGNFIKTKKAKGLNGCLVYDFDLDYFLSSEYYKEISNHYITILGINKRRAEEEYNDICSL